LFDGQGKVETSKGLWRLKLIGNYDVVKAVFFTASAYRGDFRQYILTKRLKIAG